MKRKYKRMRKLKTKYKRQVLKQIFILSQKDVDEINFHIGPLKKGDKLFVPSEIPSDPRLMTSAYDNDVLYERGYASAAMFLLRMAEYGKDYLRKDCYMYPAMFCVRMYLEIIMKLILKNYNSDFASVHDLSRLWSDTKILLSGAEMDESVEAVEKIISEFQKVDPYSTELRYSCQLNNLYNKGGKYEKAQGINKLIDIRILQERVLQLYAFFDGLYELSLINKEIQ